MPSVIEREVKLKLKNASVDKLKENLLKDGMKFEGEERQVDVYFNSTYRDFRKTDEALRIREINGEIELTYKGPKISTRSKSREEITVKINDKDAMTTILERLGFKPVATLKKLRYSFSAGKFTICLDKVEGLGDFVEVEGINAEEDELLNFVKEFTAKYGILADQERKSYLELLVEKLEANSDSD